MNTERIDMTTKTDRANAHQLLQQPLLLPCGVALKNRLVKSPMSDSLGDGEGNPTEAQTRLYERWAEGGVAVSLIGEVQFDARYPEKPGNLVLEPPGRGNNDNQLLSALARRASIAGAHIWPQIGHAGALSHLPISQPKGPSALDLEGLHCGSLSLAEIQALPEAYAKAALLAKDCGFGGVQVHAGHGFLLSQFLSPLFNFRTDAYGGAVAGRCQLHIEIIDAVRKAVGPEFPVAIRINSTDQLQGGLSEEDAMEVVRMLDQTSVDLIDISGGTYFPGAKASSDSSAGGPYFLDFAQRAKGITKIPVMATGGFKTRQQAIDALASGSVDMVGVARAMVLNERLARVWLSEHSEDPVFPVFGNTLPGGVTAWYTQRLHALAEDREDEFEMSLQDALSSYELRDEKRCVRWRKKFVV